MNLEEKMQAVEREYNEILEQRQNIQDQINELKNQLDHIETNLYRLQGKFSAYEELHSEQVTVPAEDLFPTVEE